MVQATRIETHTESVERGKQEIVEDMHAGLIPADCTTFSELHDYRDANEYGMIYAMGDDWMERANAIQCEIDEWLRRGWLARIARMNAQDEATGERAWRVTVLVNGEAAGTYDTWADDERSARTRAIRQHTDTHTLAGVLVDYDVVDLSDEPE